MPDPDPLSQPPAPPPERFEALDGLRGLAALTVVTSHLMRAMLAGAWLRFTPLYCSYEAVMLFFMLSGFVLALPFLHGPVAAGPFWLKRFVRIWPSYMVALALAAALVWCFPYPDMARFYDPWLWIDHAIMIKSFDGSFLNGVVWSLVHEMRLSLAFPLLMGLVLAASARRVVLIAMGCSLFGLVGNRVLIKFHVENDYMLTFHYGALFLVGFLLARHREALVAWWGAEPVWRRRLLFVGAAAIYTFTASVTDHLPAGLIWLLLDDWAIALAAAVIMLAALAPGRWQAFLRHPICAFLGTISYSLYLVHLPIVRVLVYRVIGGKLPQAATAAITLLVSLAVAYAFHRLVERPALSWGRKLITWRPGWVAAKPTPPKVTGV